MKQIKYYALAVAFGLGIPLLILMLHMLTTI